MSKDSVQSDWESLTVYGQSAPSFIGIIFSGSQAA
jgi:hypothetical protein